MLCCGKQGIRGAYPSVGQLDPGTDNPNRDPYLAAVGKWLAASSEPECLNLRSDAGTLIE